MVDDEGGDESDEEEDEDDYEDTDDEYQELFSFFDCIGCQAIFHENREFVHHIRIVITCRYILMKINKKV